MTSITWERFLNDIQNLHKILLHERWLPDWLICPRGADKIIGGILMDKYDYKNYQTNRALLIHLTPDIKTFQSFRDNNTYAEVKTAILYNLPSPLIYDIIITSVPESIRPPWT